MSNYYKEQRKAFEELNTMASEKDFDEDKAVFKLTLKYSVSERALRRRIELIKKVRGDL